MRRGRREGSKRMEMTLDIFQRNQEKIFLSSEKQRNSTLSVYDEPSLLFDSPNDVTRNPFIFFPEVKVHLPSSRGPAEVGCVFQNDRKL